ASRLSARGSRLRPGSRPRARGVAGGGSPNCCAGHQRGARRPEMTHLPSPVLQPRERFVEDLGAAVAAPAGRAAGKIGFSERHWLYSPLLLASTSDRRRIRAYEIAVREHLWRQSGVFPSDPRFAREFVAHHAEAVRELDWLGLFRTQLEPALIEHHRLPCRF